MLWFFHVPHTGGRAVGRFLWKHHSGKYKKLHNAADLAQALKLVPEDSSSSSSSIVKYFIFRDPVERAYREFLHYSRNLSIIGKVNHLDITELRKVVRSDFDHTDPADYFSLEVNRNVYCKFLLERTDFSVSISEDDFQHLITSGKLSEFRWDLFTSLPSLPVLEDILDSSVELLQKARSMNDVRVPETIAQLIEKENVFDLRLVAELK